MKPKIRNTLSLTIAMAGGLASASTFAQLEEIIVTAQKRAESLQDAPLSVAAYSEDMLEVQGIGSLSDLGNQSPSLQTYDFPTSTSNVSIFIRGFGNTDSQTLTIDNPVGIYVDGVYLARTSGATMDVLDLERVEILRGPQGTLFGRNSSAGAISFITKKPGEEFAGKVEAGVGNFGTWNAGATLDIPILPNLRTKLSYHSSATDGWVENTGFNLTPDQPHEDFYQKDQKGYRFAAAWDVTDNFTVDYSYDHSKVESTAPYYQQDPSKRQEESTHLFLMGGAFAYVLPESDNTAKGHNLTATWAVNDNITLKSITGYREMDEFAAQNWSDTLFFATAVDWSTKAWSQEFQLLGNVSEHLNYIVGLYYFKEEGDKIEESWTNYISATDIRLDAMAEPDASTSLLAGGTDLGARTFETDLTSKAIFGQVGYTPDILDSRLTLTAGLRYTEDEREAIRGVDPTNPSITHLPGENKLDSNRVDYSFAADYAFSDDISMYFRTATGFRAGGSGERTLDFSLTFDEEDNVSYEIGLKSEWLDRRLRVNAAAFTTDYDDLIVVFEGKPPGYSAYTEQFNAGKASVDGVELDVVGLIGDSTTITVNYTYLDTEVKDVIVPQASKLLSDEIGPLGQFNAVDLRGADLSDSTFLSLAPENAYSVSLDHRCPLSNGSSLDVNLNYVWRDNVFVTAGGIEVPDYGTLGARIALSGLQLGDSQLTLAFWGKNLTDEEDVVYNLSYLGYQYSTPRTYGLDLKVEF